MTSKKHELKFSLPKSIIQYPITPKLHFDLQMVDEKANLIEILMFHEDDTLGNLLTSIFSVQPYLTFVSYRMEHPFMENPVTQSRICKMIIKFKEKHSISEYRSMLFESISQWIQERFEPTFQALHSLFEQEQQKSSQ